MDNKMISENNIRTSIGTLSFAALALCAFNKPYDNKNADSNNTDYSFKNNNNNIEAIVNNGNLESTNNSSKNNSELVYVASSFDFVQVSDSDTVVKAPLSSPSKVPATKPVVKKSTTYGGVVVNDLQKFDNAKLIGVADASIEFYSGNSPVIYFAHGLLFELNDTKLLNLMANDYPFYIGQRYDISYHTFKKDIKVTANDILNMNLNKLKRDITIDGTNYAKRYDGVIVDYELSRKK